VCSSDLNAELKPDMVFMPSTDDLHQDHTTVASEGLRAFKHTSIYAYEMPWNNIRFRTTAFVALSEEHMERKICALSHYETQRDRPYMDEAFTRGQARTRGVQIGVPYAEAFDVVRTVYRSPTGQNSDVRQRLIAEGNAALAAIPSDRGVRLTPGRRERSLSALYQQFTFKAEYAYDSGMPHWLARADTALSPLRLDRMFLGRHKFLHFRLWYRKRLAEYVQEVLLDPMTLSRPYLHRKAVQEIVAGHISGQKNYTTTIHNLLTLELLHRAFG